MDRLAHQAFPFLSYSDKWAFKDFHLSSLLTTVMMQLCPLTFTYPKKGARSFYMVLPVSSMPTYYLLWVWLDADKQHFSCVGKQPQYPKAAQHHAWVGAGNVKCKLTQCSTTLSLWHIYASEGSTLNCFLKRLKVNRQKKRGQTIYSSHFCKLQRSNEIKQASYCLQQQNHESVIINCI